MSYRKRVKLVKGVHLNLSGSGVGLGFSPVEGLSFSMNNKGVYRNVSLSGTGLYKRTKISSIPRNGSVPISQEYDDIHYEVALFVDDEGKINTRIIGDGEEITDENELRRLKRREDIKAMISQAQYMMKDKVDDVTSEFIEIYKHTESPVSESTVMEKMNQLKYEPEVPIPFDVAEPDEMSVRASLEEEAKERISSILFWTVGNKRHEYVEAKLEQTLSRKHDEWERNKAEHELAEKERITGINCSKKYDYDSQMAAYETFLNGDDAAVSVQIDASLSALELPCEFAVDYDLDVMSGTARLNLDLPEIEDIPSKKASILANGKVSVKDKTKKELAEDYATCVTGLAFFFSGMLFNISSRINYIEVAGYTQRLDGKTGEITDQYIYAVRFDRKTFSGLKFGSIVPYESFELFPHVMDLTKQMVFKTVVPEIEA